MASDYLTSYEFGATQGREEYKLTIVNGTDWLSPAEVIDAPVAEVATYAVVMAMAKNGCSSTITIQFAYHGLMQALDDEVINRLAISSYPRFDERQA